MVMALLLAAAWHWGVPSEPALAQSGPELVLSASSLEGGNVVVLGDVLTVNASGYDPEDRVWMYLWTREDASTDFPGCLQVAIDDYLVGEGLLDASGEVSFDLDVTLPPFAAGDGNMVCVVRRGGQNASVRLMVDVPPDEYLMQLEMSEIEVAVNRGVLIPDESLDQRFKIKGSRGLSEWGDTQFRGVDYDALSLDELLVQTSVNWRACPMRGDLNVGCEWEDVSESGAELEGRSGAHLVPGDNMVLRLSLPDAASGRELNLAAERFVIFWGPVDVWLLGTERAGVTGGVAAADFVVHDEHLRPLASELNSKIVQLRPGDTVDLSITRNSSASRRGHTFVSMVACNDNYLKRLFEGAVTGEVAQQLRGLEDCTVQQGPAFEDYGTNMSPDASYHERSGEHYLREAWLQHDVLSGLGMHCSVTPTVYSDWVEIEGGDGGYWVDTWHLDVSCGSRAAPDPVVAGAGTADCYTSLTQAYSWDSSPTIDASFGDVDRMAPVAPVSAVGDNPGSPGSPAVTGVDRRGTAGYWCGWEPEHFKDSANGPTPRGYNLPWYNTRYNAANSFYSFALEWEGGGGAPDNIYGCGAMLLPYNRPRSGAAVAKYRDTSRWEVGSLPSSECEVAPGVNSVDVGLYAPNPPALNLSRFSSMVGPAKALAEYRARQAYDSVWGRYPNHSMHFAVYASGMPSAFDYNLLGGTSEDWRRVSLGAWSYREDEVPHSGSDGGRVLLGVYHPVGDSPTSGGFDAVPGVSELYYGVGGGAGDASGGLPVMVTRDFADRDGYVDVYVVPCRPLVSSVVPVVDKVEGACEHLPTGGGQVLAARFDGSESIEGPFGLSEPVEHADYVLDYSYKFRVRFLGSAWRDEDAHRVSLPVDNVAPSGDDCVVNSIVYGEILYWPEVQVEGGACDSDTLDAVRVRVVNDGRHGLPANQEPPGAGARTDRLVVYATGGRSRGLDQVQINEAGITYEDATPLGRLGTRERKLELEYDQSGEIHVSPDLADENGNVWLLFYSCGAEGAVPRHLGVLGHCPLTKKSFSNEPFYDVPAPPSFAVRVRFTPESGLQHTDLGPVCQGDDCAPLVPVLREAGPEVSDGPCGVSSYTGGSSDLLYWPDRLVRGGACAPRDLSPVSVNVSNVSGAPAQDLVFYATGGRTTGFEDVQVRRGPFTKDQESVATLADGLPAGASGLRRVYLDLDGGETGRLLVDADLADEDGTVLLLAYLCSGSSECPGGRSADREIFDVDSRPLFQVLVEYDAGLLMASGFSICKGDDCLVSYELERFDKPSGEGCSVSASYSEGSLYWPDRVIAGGNCDRYGLSDVPVNFHVPTSASDESLVVYVTGGRTPGLEGASVRRGTVASSGLGRRSVYIPFPEDVDVGDDFVRANITATVGVLDDKPWVQDGLVGVERQIYDAMQGLAGHYSGADSVAGMPFLDAVDETDYLTVRALVFAASKDLAGTVVGHSEFSGGIMDSDRILVIGASMYSYDGADKVIVRLDDGPYEVEDRIYSTPETAQLQVSIARDQGLAQDLPGASELVRKSVESMEDMMGRSFPTSHVIVFLDDGLFESIGANVVGYNYGGVALSLRTGGDGIVGTLIHEVAHYFWFGGRIWISEGMAEAAIAIFGPNLGVPENGLLSPKGDCVFGNLSELDAVLSPSNYGGDCPYHLGQALFLDLRESLGEGDFRVGVRRLYETILTKRGRGVANRQQATIDDLRAAFYGNDDAQGVIARHWSGASTAPVVAEAETLGRLGLRQRLLTVPAAGSDTVYVSPDLAGPNGDVWLFAYRCDSGHGDSGCPVLSTPVQNGYDLPKGPEFAVRVRFTPESGLQHTDLGPVCQGHDCAPLVPVLRLAGPDAPDGSCGASSYPSSPSGGLVYWPDRLVFGGDCFPNGLEEVSVAFHNATDLGGQRLVVFATGGRSPGLERVQVLRAGQPAGRTGLRRVEFSLEQGETGRVLVGPDLADDAGFVWLLAYRCEDGSDGSDSCPEVTSGGDLVTYVVDRRPLFQVMVWYDAALLTPSGFSFCNGDDCSTSYRLERFEEPSGLDCAVSASHSQGSLYWPDRVVAGGACDRYDLDDVAVQFDALASTSEERLVVYVTGGRSPGLEYVSVLQESEQSSAGTGRGRRDVFIPFPEETGVRGPQARASVSAVSNVLDGRPWVQDGLVGVESLIYDEMAHLASKYSDADLVAAMPFLDAVDETDRLTVRALIWAADYDVAGTIVDHSKFDDGIDDADRILVIGACLYADGGAGAVAGRLDAGGYKVDEDEYPTAKTPGLLVTVVRDGNNAKAMPGVAEMVRYSVESMETMMGRRFPTSHVIVFFDDGLFVGEDVLGFNYGGTAVSVNLNGHRRGDNPLDPAATVIHEVAHYFWNGGRIWIAEGMAETAVAAFGSDLDVPDGELLRPEGYCGFENLSELDAVVSLSEKDSGCPYELGQHLFWDLRKTLGVADFRVGVRRLYDALLANKALDVERDRRATLSDVRAAFSGSEVAQDVITRHWSGVAATPVVAESAILGRLGLRQQLLTVPVDGSDTVYVSPDLAGPDGDVWLLAYRCDSVHGQSGCPMLSMPVRNGYHLPEGPDFAVRVRFTPASGLGAAELQRVCLGSYCDFYDPWLRRAEPSIDECAVQLGAHWDFWPDRVIRGGGCYFRGARYGPVAFRSAVEEKFVVYTTGGDERGLELVPVYGVLGDGSSSGVESDGVPLGQHGLRESSIELDSGGEEQVWVRADMADDDGNVWLFVYRCLESYNDAGCPLVDRDQVRPSYDLLVRPAFVVRVGFLDNADSDRSSLIVDCATVSSSCKVTAIFRTADGETLPGTTEFRVDSGGLGEAGSAGRVSRRSHLMDAAGGHRFEETLILPPGSVVNVEAKLLGDGLVLRRQAGLAGNLDRLSVQIMRCSGDEMTCHAGGLERVDDLLAGDRFVLQVTGYDAAGNEALSSTTLSYAGCVAGPSSPWPEFRLNSDYLRSHGYGTTQPDDRGYAGCTVRVLDDAPVGTYPITVSYGSVTSQVQIVVAEDTSKFGYLSLHGPSHLESGESGTYRVLGFTLAGEPSGFEGGCVELNLTGALEHVESGAAMDGCLAQVLPVAGVEFTVRASDGLVYETDSSVGVSYGGRSVRQHVLAVPAVDGDVASPSVSESHISDLTITQEDTQLKISWVSNPTSEFVSLRAQGWVMVGGVDVFLPGCQGGEVWETTTYEVFCLLSYGQSGDVYRAAVVFIRFDNSAMPVETAEWTLP